MLTLNVLRFEGLNEIQEKHSETCSKNGSLIIFDCIKERRDTKSPILLLASSFKIYVRNNCNKQNIIYIECSISSTLNTIFKWMLIFQVKRVQV